MKRPCVVHQFASPICDIIVAANPKNELLLLYFMGERHAAEEVIAELRANEYEPEWNAEALTATTKQIDEYFTGRRREFDLPLAPSGTPFQMRVWQELQRIPFGETISYGELAARVGNAKASRAVGAANGQNPISLIIPCHRVIGSDKSLTGYGGGLTVKEALLKHEGATFRGSVALRGAAKESPQAELGFALR
jgi:methylated-DNA-[protein]-cysteine S-methyltransferase